jgi:hypothetical protein
MLFFKSMTGPPASEGRLLIAEYATLGTQAEIPLLVDDVAELLFSQSDHLAGYTLRSVGRSMSGDLRKVAFLWDATSREAAVNASKIAREKVGTIQESIVDVEVHFLKPTDYDRPHNLQSAKVLATALKKRGLGDARAASLIECGLHDNISLRDRMLPTFLAKAGPLIPTFIEQTQWAFSGAGSPIAGGDRVMHFWRLTNLGTVPEAMTTLSDIPAYGKIQDLILTENQNFYMQARNDLPVGLVNGTGVEVK